MPLSISATAAAPYLYNYDASAAAVLTLGPHLTSPDRQHGHLRLGRPHCSGIVNQGTINAGYNGGSFTMNDIRFTNQGTINVSNGDSVTIKATSFSNAAGGILSLNGGTLSITRPAGRMPGRSARSGGTLNLGRQPDAGASWHGQSHWRRHQNHRDAGQHRHDTELGTGTALGAVALGRPARSRTARLRTRVRV